MPHQCGENNKPFPIVIMGHYKGKIPMLFFQIMDKFHIKKFYSLFKASLRNTYTFDKFNNNIGKMPVESPGNFPDLWFRLFGKDFFKIFKDYFPTVPDEVIIDDEKKIGDPVKQKERNQGNRPCKGIQQIKTDGCHWK
jgi:hypothetical protein